MKKPTAFCLIFIFLLSLFPVTVHADGVKYKVNTEVAYILNEPAVDADSIAECPKGRVVYVDSQDEKGTFVHVTIPGNGISGWVYAPLLTPVLQNGQGENLLYVAQNPAKTEYIEGEEVFDESGLVLAFGTNPPKLITAGYKIFVPDLYSYGEKTVYITYTPPESTVYYTTSFTITVKKVPLTSLSINTLPTTDPMGYIEGESLDLTGLTLKATYSDGRPDRIFTLEEITADSDFLFSGCHSEKNGSALSLGTHRLQFIYKYPEISCTLQVGAVKKKLTSLSVKTYPASTVMYTGNTTPDLTGLVLSAGYSNGLYEDVTPDDCTVIFDADSLVYGEGNTVEVKYVTAYGTMSVFLDYTYAVYDTKGIKVKTPEVLTYILGFPIDLSAYKVYIEYTDGTLEQTENYTLSDINYLMTGAQTVTVTAGIYSATFTIYITPYYRLGDINGDGNITAADARLALRHTVGYINLADKPFTAGDINKDNIVDASDARMILRAAVGLEDFLTKNSQEET